jgi:ubiquitin carboxyl-terminal hydrolase 36/42
VKQQQQCKLLPSNGQSHMILADATLNCESSLKTTEDPLRQDCESNNGSLHEMDIKDQESDLDLCTSIEDDKFISNENLHIPGSHVLEDTRAPDSFAEQCEVQLGPPLEGGRITMSSVQFGSSTCKASSEHSFAEQCEVPAPCIDSVDYMDLDTEAAAEVVLDDSVGRPNNNSEIPTANGMSGEPKPSFSSGFFDKPSRKRSSFAEEDSAGSPRKLNGYCNGHLSSLEQGILANSGSEKCNGDTLATSSNGNCYAVNGDAQSRNDSLDADKGDVPFVSHGFEPRPYKVLSDSNNNCSRTSNGKPKAYQGDMSFLPRGFLGRSSSRGISVKADDGLPFSNGASSSFGNGKSKSSNHSSSIGGLSPGFLTRHRRESIALGTSSDISMDTKSNGAAVMPEGAEEMVSDCTTNGSSFQIRASDHLDENGLAILHTKSNSCGQENDSNGTPSMNHDGSEHGLRRRITSKFFEQDGIDAQ